MAKSEPTITFTGAKPLKAYSLILPKPIAIVRICGAIVMTITDKTEGFVKPTPEQIKNLKEMLCIDVELLEEEVRNDEETVPL